MGVSSSHRTAALLATLAIGCGAAERPPPGLDSWGIALDDAATTGTSTAAEDADGTTFASGPQTTEDTGAAATSGGETGPDDTQPGSGPGPGSGPTTTTAAVSAGGQSTTSTAGDDSGQGESSTSAIVGTFDPGQPFGDDEAELDLIGTWGLPRYDFPQSWEARLTITTSGDFAWIEHDPDCEIVTEAFGTTWVENNQLVFHFDAYHGAFPWPTEAAIGQTIEAPFRVRLGYAPAGLTLGLAAPQGWTATAPWEGQALVRQTATSGPEGSWANESQLEALVEDSPTAQVILVDRYDLELRPDGTGVSTMTRTYHWPRTFIEPPIHRDAAWADGNPGSSAGSVTINGRPFAYDAARILSFGQ